MVTPEFSTASYSAIMNNGGELLMGVGDMDIHDQISPEYVSFFLCCCRAICTVVTHI